jgi:hypothetical protein
MRSNPIRIIIWLVRAPARSCTCTIVVAVFVGLTDPAVAPGNSALPPTTHLGNYTGVLHAQGVQEAARLAHILAGAGVAEADVVDVKLSAELGDAALVIVAQQRKVVLQTVGGRQVGLWAAGCLQCTEAPGAQQVGGGAQLQGLASLRAMTV